VPSLSPITLSNPAAAVGHGCSACAHVLEQGPGAAPVPKGTRRAVGADGPHQEGTTGWRVSKDPRAVGRGQGRRRRKALWRPMSNRVALFAGAWGGSGGWVQPCTAGMASPGSAELQLRHPDMKEVLL